MRFGISPRLDIKFPRIIFSLLPFSRVSSLGLSKPVALGPIPSRRGKRFVMGIPLTACLSGLPENMFSGGDGGGSGEYGDPTPSDPAGRGRAQPLLFRGATGCPRCDGEAATACRRGKKPLPRQAYIITRPPYPVSPPPPHSLSRQNGCSRHRRSSPVHQPTSAWVQRPPEGIPWASHCRS